MTDSRPTVSDVPAGRSGDLLEAVSKAAARALEAQAAGETDAAVTAAVTEAAKAALDAGVALSDVAAAESAGQTMARDGLRAEVLRGISRSAKKLREATAEYESSVARGASLGLGAREIAERAGVAHGTVAAIVRRQQRGGTDIDAHATDGDRPDASVADVAPVAG